MGKVIGITKTYSGTMAQFSTVKGGDITSLSVPITPTQDLHGYSKPWAAGAGRNKMPYPWFKNQGSITLNGLTITFNSDGSMSMAGTASANTWVYQNAYDAQGTYNFEFPAGDYIMSAEGVTGGSASGYRFQMSVYSKSPYSLLRTYYVYNGETINVHINAGECEACYLYVPSGKDCDGITYKPMLRLSTDADATYEPYENDCPINGLTSLSVYRSGKNLFGFSSVFASGSGTTISKAQKTGTIVVKNTSSTRYCGFGVWYNGILSMKPFPAGKYTLSFDVSGDWGGVNFAFGVRSVASNTFVNSETVYFSAAGHYTMTFDSSAWTEDYYISASRVGNSTADIDVTFYDLQIEVGETASAFEPYANNAYSANWYAQAGTVYDGSYDFISGLLTSNMANIASYNGETIGEPWLSSLDEYTPGGTPTTGAQIVYMMSEPTVYSISAYKVTAFTGVNNVWEKNGTMVYLSVIVPATGFNGWLIKCLTDGTGVEIPLKYMRAETYSVTPDQRMEWSAERDVTGVLHRETVQNLPPKIEFSTPLMDNSGINALNTIIRNAYTDELQRNITIQFYDPERNEYWEWDCYMPDVHYQIRNVDVTNHIINYEETRYAFIGY